MNIYSHNTTIKNKLIKDFNESLSSAVQRYVDKKEVVPTKVFIDYCSKIDNIQFYIDTIIKEYELWYKKTINSFTRNRTSTSFYCSPSFTYLLVETYLKDKQQATASLLKALKEQNPPSKSSKDNQPITAPKVMKEKKENKDTASTDENDNLLVDLYNALLKQNITKQDILDLIQTLSD